MANRRMPKPIIVFPPGTFSEAVVKQFKNNGYLVVEGDPSLVRVIQPPVHIPLDEVGSLALRAIMTDWDLAYGVPHEFRKLVTNSVVQTMGVELPKKAKG